MALETLGQLRTRGSIASNNLARAGGKPLPLGPTGYGNSPYQPLSSFAGNALVISPEWLVEDELLATSDCEHPPFPAGAVDYGAIIPFKHRLLEKAWNRFRTGTRADLCSDYEKFCHDHDQWLPDYALFRALKAKFGNGHYLEWPSELVQRKPEALEQARSQLSDRIGRASFSQFLLFRQAERLRAHAHEKKLTLMGDLPFFVSGDSSDVWANPQFFLLDEQYRPRFVAGVPPIISVRRDNSGAIPSTTGTPFGRRATVGG